MRDDTTAPEDESPSRLNSALESLRAIPWRNARSGKWWRRWFKNSIYQSGRLSTFLFLFFLLTLQLEDPGIMQLIRARVFDFYQQTRPRPVPENSPVIIVDIDEKSLAELGQFPWPRSVLAQMVSKLSEAGVSAIGFDVMFPEEDQTSISKVITRVPENVVDPATRKRLSTSPTNDQIFAEAIAASSKVILGTNSTDQPMKYEGDPPSVSFVTRGDDPAPFLDRNPSLVRPIPVLDNAAAGWGLLSLSQKFFDGIVRQVPMAVAVGGKLNPALTLEMLRVQLGAKSYIISTDARAGVSGITMRNIRTKESHEIKTDANGQVWIYFRPHSTFQNSYISATDIINGRVPKENLEGKLALVGTSATGLFDLRSTPLDAVLPGVEAHANILENVIFKQQLTRPPTAPLMEFATTFIVGMIIMIVTPMAGARIGVMTFFAIAGGLSWYSWNAFTSHLELYDPTFPIFVALFFYSFLTYAGYTHEEAQRKQVRTAFGQYLSPALVQKLAEDPTKLTLGGENKDMTYMFSDIRGFTGISELFDAQGLTRLINRLLTPLTNAIMSTHGTIDKYMGDCVMAFWNAPLDVKDHGAAACRSALRMIDSLHALNDLLEKEAIEEKREHRPLKIGIGINSGIACVGNMGSEQRFGYSVLGDSVNLASRLEGQSKSYGVTIVVGENTVADPEVQKFALLELDLIKVKGKQHAVRIFTLLGDAAVAATGWFAQLKETHAQALAAYRAQDWDGAEQLIAKNEELLRGQSGLVLQILEYYEIARERIAGFRANPPGADWNGVYVATSK